MNWNRLKLPKNECGCDDRDVRCPNDNECVNHQCWKCGWVSPRGEAEKGLHQRMEIVTTPSRSTTHVEYLHPTWRVEYLEGRG